MKKSLSAYMNISLTPAQRLRIQKLRVGGKHHWREWNGGMFTGTQAYKKLYKSDKNREMAMRKVRNLI